MAGTAALAGAGRMANAASAWPDYYPSDYQKLVEASKAEKGLLIYSNMAEYNWRPVIQGFNALYPWIKVQTLDLDNDQFERYYAEKASKARTTDMIITGAVDQWLEFMKRGEAADYQSAESGKIPDWSKPMPGLYTASTDPMIIVYNKRLLKPEQAPKSLADIAKLAQSDKSLLNNRLTTYNAVAGAFGLAINWFWTQKNPDAWKIFDVIGPMTRPEHSAGPMVEKITTGEDVLGWFLSGIVVFPKMNDPARKALLGWNFISDGTPLFMRGMAITKGASSPNSAKMMLDFILSHSGQVAFGKGGLTPYRPDVQKSEVPYQTYGSVMEAVGGEKNIVLISYDQKMLDGRKEFLDRWKKSFPNAA
jgi:iron(III) transport system substrate-binding protein